MREPTRSIDIELNACDELTASTFADLEAYCFPAQDNPVGRRKSEILNDPRCPINRYFLARVGGDVVGGFRILPLEMRVAHRDDGWIQVGGLGRLGVYPNYRRQGYADGVMRLVMQRSYEQGDVFSLLYPHNYSTYRRYGYGVAARHAIYNAPPRAFPNAPGRDQFRPATIDDWEAINHCYENQVWSTLGILKRNERTWKDYYLNRSIDDTWANWVFTDDGVTTGYISTRYRSTAKFFHQRLQVAEWFASSKSALQAILSFLRAQSANVEMIQLPAPLGCSLESVLMEPAWQEDPDQTPWHQSIGSLCSTLMWRVIRVRDALTARQYAGDGQINLLVEDWVLPDNSGYYSLRTRNGRGEIGSAIDRDLDIRLDVSALSTLYSGGISASHARRFGLIDSTPEAAALLDHMLSPDNFMVWDYF